MHENDNKRKVSTATIKISCVIYLFYSFHDWQLNILLLFHMKMFDWMVHSCIGVVHILRNQLRGEGGGGGFPNDYASVILTQ